MKICCFAKITSIYFLTLLVSTQFLFSQGTNLFEKDSICILEEIQIETPLFNNHINSRFNFNKTSLDSNFTIEKAFNYSEIGPTWDLELIQEDSLWYGFSVSFTNDNLYRLEYGSSPLNNPVIVPLGNLNGVLSSPLGIDFVRFKNKYVGVISNWSDGELVFIDFINGISEEPTGTKIENLPSINLPIATGIFTNENDEVIISAESNSSNEITFIKLNTNLDLNAVDFFSLPTITSPNGDDVYRTDSVSYMAIHSRTGAIRVHKFKNDLTSIIETYNFNTNLSGAINIIFIPTNQNTFRLIGNYNDGLFSLDFDPKTGKFTDLKSDETLNGSSLGNPRGLKHFNLDNEAYLLVPGNNNNLYLLKHQSIERTDKSFIEYTAFDTIIDRSIFFLDSVYFIQPPQTNITTFQTCTDTNTILNNENDGDFYSRTWEIDGDNITSSSPSITYKFELSQEYNIKLKISDICGRSDSIFQTVNIVENDDITASLRFTDTLCTQALTELRNNSSFTNDTIKTFQWVIQNSTNDTLFNSNEPNTQVTFPEQETYSIYLKATGNSGCGDDTLLTITPLQGPPASFSFADTCFNETFVAFENTADLSITSLEWRLADTLYSTEEFITIPNNSFETRNLQLRTFNEIGCESIKDKTFEIYPLPVADFDSTFFCLDQAKQILNRSTIIDNTPLNYRWVYNSTVLSTEENPGLLLTDINNRELQLITTSFAGCTDTISQNINIVTRPEAAFEFSTACLGDPTALKDTSNSLNNITSYVWNLPNTTLNGKEVNFTFSSAGEFPVKLIVTDELACVDTLTRSILIDSLPDASFTNTLACTNTSTLFTNTSTLSNDSLSSVLWSIVSQGETLSGEEISVDFTTTGNSLVQLNLTTIKGCESSTSKLITVNPAPASLFSIPETIGSPVFTVLPENNSTNSTSFKWFISETNEESTETEPVFNFSDFGSYTISLETTSSTGCKDTSSVEISVVDPLVDLVIGNIQSREENGNVTLSLDVTNLGNFTLNNTELEINYGGIFSASQLATESIENNSTSTLTLNQTLSKEQFNQLSYVCIASRAGEQLALEENLENNTACLILDENMRVDRISPMPVRDNFTVNYFIPSATDVSLELHNSLGKLVYQKENSNLSAGPHSEEINVIGLVDEFYILTIKTPSEIITKRISRL